MYLPDELAMLAGSRRFATTGCGLFCFVAFMATAQPAQTGESNPDASTQSIKRQAYPVIDPAVAPAGSALLAALQKGGFVLYLRHTETGAITEQCNVSNLSPGGMAMARELGAQLKRLRIPVGRVVSSPVCRVQETARLLEVGDVELSHDLAQAAKPPAADLYSARMRQLAAVPRPGTNTLLVSHMHAGVPRYQTMDLEFGEVIVYRTDGKNGVRPVARIRAEGWSTLAAADGVAKPQ